MVAYLSDDWVRLLDEALAEVAPAASGVDGGLPTSVQFEVVDGPGGDRCWHLTLGPDGTRAAAGPAAEPAVRFSQHWSTALAVAQARRGTQEALLAGDIRVNGDPTRLVPWRRAVQQVEGALAGLNASTTFPAAAAEPTAAEPAVPTEPGAAAEPTAEPAGVPAGREG